MTSGFAESEDAGAAELTRKLKAVIGNGHRDFGPICLGNLHAPANLMTMPDTAAEARGRPVRLSASPAASPWRSSARWKNAASIRVRHHLGTETGLSRRADYIGYFARQPGVRAIVSYLEAVHDPGAFLAACREARANGKPVVV